MAGLLIQDAENSELPPSQTYHRHQLLCSASEKRKGWEEIMNLLSLLSKHFNIAGAFFSYSTFERQLSHEKSGTSNIYVGRQTWGKISVHVFLPVNTILNI